MRLTPQLARSARLEQLNATEESAEVRTRWALISGYQWKGEWVTKANLLFDALQDCAANDSVRA
eukprot:m.642554 g.642554  ORF g.642554 m.642554 type:complete len:64 (-) comp58346_c0_seq21:2053-2244(-)